MLPRATVATFPQDQHDRQDARPHQLSPRGRAIHARTATSGLFFALAHRTTQPTLELSRASLYKVACAIALRAIPVLKVLLIPVSLSTKWFHACCSLVALLLVAGLLWNPVADATDKFGAGGTVMAEASFDAEQPDRDLIPPAVVDASRRAARTEAGNAISRANRAPLPGPVFPPPERPPRT